MSDAVHISEILPAVMADIDARMQRRRTRDHHERVLGACRDFHRGRKRKPARHEVARR